MRRLPGLRLLLLLAGLLAGSQALSHALQPGFLELRALSEDVWQVLWKKPTVNGSPMQIEAVLPENCDIRRAPEMLFDGTAWLGRWAASCPGGLEGGGISVEGLELTQTDVLIRYEPSPGATAESRRLTAAETSFTVPAPRGAIGVFVDYTKLGVEHILGGIDHLLFVFALLLLVRDTRRLVGAITAFTVAHSITLAASALGWVSVPVAPVEAVIALSIVFLATEIASGSSDGQRLSERFPWVVSFSFGLLHGFGFASALREIGLPEGEVPLALLAFNVGVEIGQLMFVAVVLLAGAVLARMVAARRLLLPGGAGMLAAAYVIGGVSAYWTIERIAGFLSG